MAAVFTNVSQELKSHPSMSIHDYTSKLYTYGHSCVHSQEEPTVLQEKVPTAQVVSIQEVYIGTIISFRFLAERKVLHL